MTTPRCVPSFVPVASPYGCVVTPFLSSDEEVRAMLDQTRPAPRVRGAGLRVVCGQRDTALYNAHSYHTKLPPEAVAPFLRRYTRTGDVVLDPFCGSGMTGVAAQLTGRRAILSDLSVAAAHLSFNHTRPCNPEDLQRAFIAIANDLEGEFRDLYSCVDGKKRGYVYYTLWSRDAICPSCGKRSAVWDMIDRDTGRMPSSIRCPGCRRTMPKNTLKYAGNRPVLLSYERATGGRHKRAPTRADLALIGRHVDIPANSWFPDVSVESTREMYIRSALHLQGIDTVADFYTTRNLLALSRLWERIQQVADERVRAALAFAFTNTAWHGTRMRRFNARGGQRPLTGTLYIPQLSSEANVLEVMRNKIKQLRSFYNALGSHKNPLPAIRLGSATNLHGIPDRSVDYVFTDPPFGSNIFYSDCNLIWESWLGGLTPPTEEAVVNRSRGAAIGGKTVAAYQQLMEASMLEIHRVLKPGAWVTLVFHNTDPEVWCAIQSAAEMAGFEIKDAGALDRKQHSHKGYKGRAGKEDVAHFDVIMSMRKREIRKGRGRQRAKTNGDTRKLVLEALNSLPPTERTVQRVHSQVIQLLARNGHSLGAISFNEVRETMPLLQPRRRSEASAASLLT